MTNHRALRLDPSDNVLFALDGIFSRREPAPGGKARERGPSGDRVAAVAVEEGAPSRLLGQVSVFDSGPILPADWVHSHVNAVHNSSRHYHGGEHARLENIAPGE